LLMFWRGQGRSETGRPSLCDLGAKDLINLNRDLADAAQGIGHYDQPNEVRWTFGEFAKRLEALCPDTPVTKSDWLSIDAYLTEAVSA
jgi:type IV secretory pathway TrbF-like protein